ncbi:MAG TPA: ribose-phosphate diphosphokinase [Gammaproteobacteria bacterium]
MIAANDTLLLGFSDYAPQARALAAALSVAYAEIEVHRFPDGESRLRLPERLPEHVLLCRSLNDPNGKLVELLFAAETARELGARKLTLVAPYLCYMRQDTAFQPGETVSQRSVGRWLGAHFDTVITVDPHLHRIHDLAQVIRTGQALSLSAAPLLGTYAARAFDQPLLLGPDAESAQWVAAAAQAGGLQSAVADKQRRGDRSVQISLPGIDVQARTVVLIDDIASTGCTLARAAEALYIAGAAEVHALVTHALFVNGAEQRLHDAGVRSLHSSDSIAHPSNAVALAELLAEACHDRA